MKQAERTSWAYCPKCRHDLNGDNDSFVSDTNEGVRYTCAKCKFNSWWDFEPPAPVYVGQWWPARPAEWVDPLGDIARFAGYARERHEALLRDAAEQARYGEQET